MALASDFQNVTAELSASVEAAAETLVIVWGRAQEALRPPVSGSQLRALLVVERAGALNLNGLAEELGAIPSSASRLCDRLQASGLLTRTPGRTDRREVTLSLTPDGRALLVRMRAARQAEISKVLAAMPPADRDRLLAGLLSFRRGADGR
jgi:DNA-binding MarR family transcriptional regulator